MRAQTERLVNVIHIADHWPNRWLGQLEIVGQTIRSIADCTREGQLGYVVRQDAVDEIELSTRDGLLGLDNFDVVGDANL